MSTLRAILELQGSLDTAVIRTADPRVAEIADSFLPGTSANPGWYREIEAIMFPPAEARTEALPVEAINELASDWHEHGRRPTIPESSRLMYGLGAVIHLIQAYPRDLQLPFDDPTAEGARGALATVFALTGPDDPDETRSFIQEQLPRIIEVFAGFNGWEDWDHTAEQLVALNVFTKQAASVPPCQAVVVNVKGVDAVVIDVDMSSDTVSLNELEAVADPRNWHYDYPDFFCSMEYKGLRSDGWRRVLERVGICQFSPLVLRTMLKFYKTTFDGPDTYAAFIDYDLNDPVPDPQGDGKITVDRGFINMWCTNPAGPTEGGVRVRIRKVAHITGMSTYAMKKLVCILGYADVAVEMLFGTAGNPGSKIPYVPWADDPNEQPGPAPAAGGTKPAPGQSNNTVASTAIKMVADCVSEMTAKQSDLVDKWAAGELKVSDLAQYSAEVGARLASDPWKFLQAIGKPKGGGA